MQHTFSIGSDIWEVSVILLCKIVLVCMFVTNLFSCCNHIALHLYTIGADPKAKDIDGETPLMWTCRRGHKDISALLLEHGEPKQDMKGIWPAWFGVFLIS